MRRLGAMLREAFEAKKRMNPHIAEQTPIEAMLDGRRGGRCDRGEDLRGGRRRLPADRLATRGSCRRAIRARVDGRSVRAVRGRSRRRAGPARRPPLDALASMTAGPGATRRRFVLLDRDGTINEEVGHLSDAGRPPADPGLGRRDPASALRRSRASSSSRTRRTWAVGCSSRATLERDPRAAAGDAGRRGREVDAILHCPHAPEEGCDCRKPAPGMAVDAADRFSFDLARGLRRRRPRRRRRHGPRDRRDDVPRAHRPRCRGTRAHGARRARRPRRAPTSPRPRISSRRSSNRRPGDERSPRDRGDVPSRDRRHGPAASRPSASTTSCARRTC